MMSGILRLPKPWPSSDARRKRRLNASPSSGLPDLADRDAEPAVRPAASASSSLAPLALRPKLLLLDDRPPA